MSETIDQATTRAYLTRIAVDQVPAAAEADEATLQETKLRALHRAHLLAVPFENLDIHIGRPIELATDRIVAKIVEENRGGFCYELNGGFAALLRSLGFEVTLLEARVHTDDGPGIRFDHLCLRVDLDRPFLVDVGFGALFMEPILLQPGLEQTEGSQRFTIKPVHEPGPADDEPSPVDDGWFDLFKDDAPQYRFTPHRGPLSDFEPGCRYHQTSPDSHFTASTVCTRPTSDGGRTTVSGKAVSGKTVSGKTQSGMAQSGTTHSGTTQRGTTPSGFTLTETEPGGKQQERALSGDEIDDILRARFDIFLSSDNLDQLRSAEG